MWVQLVTCIAELNIFDLKDQTKNESPTKNIKSKTDEERW